MKVAVAGEAGDFSTRVAAALRERAVARGHVVEDAASGAALDDDVQLAINLTVAAEPRAHHVRTRASHFVLTLADAEPSDEPVDRAAYRVLVRTMSNLLLYSVTSGADRASWLVTPELGCTRLPQDGALAAAVADKALALAGARWVIDNEVVEDLPEALWRGDETVRRLQRAGRALDGLGLLPTVLPLDELLGERDRRLLAKVFGITQLSYGNLSARHDATSFWMSGRGADKGRLGEVGRDILLVTGVAAAAGRVRLSVPAGAPPSARVSVDAVEHALLYAAFPAIGAIVHVHAWLPGIDATRQNWPCGTVDLAEEVLALASRQPDPARCVVGLVNHGITATGPDLETILATIAPRLERRVPAG